MADIFPSYPSATTGKGAALFMKLSGNGLTNANPQNVPSGAVVGGNNTYKVTLSVANSASAGVSATVQVTASLYDLAGTSQSIVGSVTALSYNFLPTANASGENLSYIGKGNINCDGNGFYTGPVGAVASVGTVSFSNSAALATITPLSPGQAVVEFEYPFAGEDSGLTTGSPAMRNDKVFSQVLVNVLP